jgi:hypothetical protein
MFLPIRTGLYDWVQPIVILGVDWVFSTVVAPSKGKTYGSNLISTGERLRQEL